MLVWHCFGGVFAVWACGLRDPDGFEEWHADLRSSFLRRGLTLRYGRAVKTPAGRKYFYFSDGVAYLAVGNCMEN